jgi:monoamine oxidase
LWRETRGDQEQIVAWVGGPRALTFAGTARERVVDAAVASLAQATGTSPDSCRAALIEAHEHDFSSDPHVRGAYSYTRPNRSGLAGQHPGRRLAEGWSETLLFAGEALDLQYPGTVAGALGSGEHAARRLLAQWSN